MSWNFGSKKKLLTIVIMGVLGLLGMVMIAWKYSLFPPHVNTHLKFMSLGTVFCLFILLLALLIKLHLTFRRLTNILCSAVLIFAFCRFIELSTESNFLDAIFISVVGVSLNHIEGGMSPLTSICLILLSLAIIVDGEYENGKENWRNLAKLIITFYIIFLVIIALSGYLLDIESAFTGMGMRMSLQTSTSILILAVVNYAMSDREIMPYIYKAPVWKRFLIGLSVVIILGMIFFVIITQQIHYVERINRETILNLISTSSHQSVSSVDKLIKSEHEIKTFIMALAVLFIGMCVLIFWSVYASLMIQLKKLCEVLLKAAGNEIVEIKDIPYRNDFNEFGVIGKSIELFVELHKSQKELQLKLQKMIESMPNGVIMINKDGIIELVNKQTCIIFDYSREDLLGKPVEILLLPEYANIHPHYRNGYFLKPEIKTMGGGRELYGITQKGKSVALEIGLAPIESENDLKVLASIVDITEKKLAEKNLALSREKVEVTSKSLGIGIWEFEYQHNKLIWDETMFLLYDSSPDEFTGSYEFWRDRVHPDDVAEQEKIFMEAIEKGIEFNAKFRVIGKNGKIKYIQAKAKVEINSAGNLTRIIGTNFDVTREEITRKQLQELDSLRASIVEFSEDAIISKTKEGVVTSWNKAAERLFGYDADEAVGRNVKDLIILPARKKAHDELIDQVKKGTLIRNYQSQLRCKSGKIVDVSLTYSPIRDDKGNIISISSIKRDVTENIKAANKLIAKQKELERSNKSLETFAYVASHDLKAPLRGISQLVSWLDEDIEQNNIDAIPDTTQKIKVRIKRMESLLDDLLAYSRVEKMQGYYKEVDLNQLVNDLFIMNNTKLGILLKINNILPVFFTCSAPLGQVINNLFSNAMKHHDRSDGLIQFSSADINADFYEFSVEDDGPGIDSQYHERIFRMFQTLKPRDEVEGSGMGLALVKKIVEQYGGIVGVQSESRGSRFYFTWPKIIKQEPDDESW